MMRIIFQSMNELAASFEVSKNKKQIAADSQI